MLRAALVFSLCWCLTLAGILLDVPAMAFLGGAVGMAAWAVGMRASWREGRRRLARCPRTPSGFPRRRGARALVLSWMIPGAGELALGLPRWPAVMVLAVFLVVAVPVWASLVPYLVALPFAAAVWIVGQQRFRTLTGWGWTPLLPAWGELLARGGRDGTAV
jgi:hypothetical protein